MKARIKITLKTGVLDPQGKAIGHALESLGFSGINEVRQGKYIEVNLAESDPTKAREKLGFEANVRIANTVIENYAFELEG